MLPTCLALGGAACFAMGTKTKEKGKEEARKGEGIHAETPDQLCPQPLNPVYTTGYVILFLIYKSGHMNEAISKYLNTSYRANLS